MFRGLIKVVEQAESNRFVKWIALGFLALGVVALSVFGQLWDLLVPITIFGLAMFGAAMGKFIGSFSARLFTPEDKENALKLEVAFSLLFFVLLPGIGMHIWHLYFVTIVPYASLPQIFGAANLASLSGYVLSKRTVE
ncbi:hypothetical protein ALP8811_02467 [Aliiroseovarius pelagivivens]|uniref:Uncharacterized protein n=1 Tax=Aliiroseovarius pelagivivens TaxID=1639690 RepID=A0A2R8ARE6_9RHOB|nr:hypothetical protein [Aliiroseovarius pelagivivens]SPF78540.1 hypothetical protein ALP8811_02467 [Aliiroseovarius pelagivivens]